MLYFHPRLDKDYSSLNDPDPTLLRCVAESKSDAEVAYFWLYGDLVKKEVYVIIKERIKGEHVS
jgi:hypothetical protein